MFGYVMVNQRELSEEAKERFSAWYCGLCRTLQREYGLTGRLTLTYDMTFLTVLLSSLYEPETKAGEGRCPVHPAKKRAWRSNEITQYAAAMNFALTYHKLIDDWEDDRSVLALSGAKLMARRYARVEAQWPRQCAAIRRCLQELAALEKEKCAVIDAPANCFGTLLGEIFVLHEDEWAEDLHRMGAALGAFVYVLDAWDDLDKDRKKGRYNPLAALAGGAEQDSVCQEMLTLLMARCTETFETLPLVEDMEILRNILYSGVWTRCEGIRRRHEGGGKGAQA